MLEGGLISTATLLGSALVTLAGWPSASGASASLNAGCCSRPAG